jgi:YD repeat-containing protein
MLFAHVLAAMFSLFASSGPRVEPSAVHPAATMTCSVGSESISPCTSTKVVHPGDSISVTYTLQNNYIETDAFDISTSLGSIASSCTPTLTPVTVNSHSQAQFTLNCIAVGTGGTGTITVIASGGIQTLTSTISVTVNAMLVKPDTSYTVQPTSVDTQSYAIKNQNASGSVTVKLSKSCATFTCTILDAVANPLAHGNTATVRIQYTAGAQGTNDQVKLIAWDSLKPTTSVDTGIVSVSVPVPLAPTVATTPHNGDNHSVGLCVAGCFDLSLSYSTPAYQSMGVARSATLVYNSAQARALPIVQVDVIDPSTYRAQSMTLKVKDGGAFMNFRNHSQALYFYADTGGAANRLAGQFDTTASAFSTGVRFDTVTVISNWTSGPYYPSTTTTSVPAVVLVVNEQSSVFGAGWSLAGLQRMYFPDTLTFAVTDGAGSITRFTRTCGGTCAATTVADFTTIVPIDSSGIRVRYERRARDGSVAAFSTTGYLKYVADRFTDTTKFAYDGSNRISTITDPVSKQLTFAYNAGTGKLSTITDPAGRVTTFYVSANLDSIKDVTNTLTFRGSYDGHHLLTQRTDRGGNTWMYTYDFASKLASDSTPTVNVDTAIAGTSASLRAIRLGSAQRSLERVILIDTAQSYGTSGTPAPLRLSAKVRAAAYSANGDSITFKVDRFYAALQVEQLSRLDTTYLTRDVSERVTAALHRLKLKTVANSSATFDGPRFSTATDWIANASVSYS